MANNKFGKKQQKGSFTLVGKVKGTSGKNFFVEGETKTGKISRTFNIGIETDLDGNRIYVGGKAYSKVDAIFYNKEKKMTVKRPFDERAKFLTLPEAEGFQSTQSLGFGLTGDKEDNKNVHIYDAIPMITGGLEEDMEVRVIGEIEYSSYQNKNGEKVSKKDFVVKRIYKSEVDMTKENYEPISDFKQELIYVGLDKVEVEKDEKPYMELTALVMQYQTLERAVFRIYNVGLAKTIKKNCKPYTAMTVTGNLISKTVADEVVETKDDWGVAPKSYKAFTKRETYMEIMSVDPATFDTESYTQEELDKILTEQSLYGKDDKKDDEENVKDDFGTPSKNVTADEEDWDF